MTELEKVDLQMKNVINSKKLSDAEKIREHGKLLRQFKLIKADKEKIFINSLMVVGKALSSSEKSISMETPKRSPNPSVKKEKNSKY